MDGVMALVGVLVLADIVCLQRTWAGLAAQRRQRLVVARTLREGGCR